METTYLIMVIVLFVLAFSDLIVGVSNDAVNFLNSALGAKVASLKLVMFIAAIGVLVGATFSSGMMEVARKGIFNPQHFYFNEIMVIFLAVMITDIILLDGFNTFGMPTSTTVSIVFELLGAAVALSVIKIYTDPNSLALSEYINTSKALAIISGILLSVGIAFTVGAIVQYISRLLFSFNSEKNIKYYGGLFGGIAVTAITYFILIKGAKDASFMTSEVKSWITHNSILIIAGSFIFWTVLLQLLNWIFKINILKFVVLVGTFALAMAFAGNDLVNFIGVPLAGFAAYQTYMDTPGHSDHFLMDSLAGKVDTPTYMLVIAGIVMIITLYKSKKAQSVVKTELNLARQDEGYERFGSSILARSIVGSMIKFSQSFRSSLPTGIRKRIEKRFDDEEYNQKVSQLEDPPMFDLIRASVNLVVASILIAFATSLKLPLSTTYVTFMVAMGTSLADKAWGRDSAVYRITGVMSVIGGWFLTAFIAFSAAFIIANIIYWGGIVAIILLIIGAAITIYRTQKIHARNTEKTRTFSLVNIVAASELIQECTSEIKQVLEKIQLIYGSTINNLVKENRKKLRKDQEKTREIVYASKNLKNNSYDKLRKLKEESVDTGIYYIQVLDHLREACRSLQDIVDPSFEHVDNHHKSLSSQHKQDVGTITDKLSKFFNRAIKLLENPTDKDVTIDSIIKEKDYLLNMLDEFNKSQIKRIRKKKESSKVSVLYLNILQETKVLSNLVINILKAHETFRNYAKK